MWFTRVSIHNPVFAAMMMLALVVLGLFSMQRLQVDQFPNIDLPVVVVQTDYPGASPETVESEVTKKMEEVVNSIAGIDQLSSRSYEGTSVVVIQFALTRKAEDAAQDVRDKIAIVKPALRKEVKEPRVLRFDPSSAPIFSLAVRNKADSTSPRSLVQLSTIADQLVRKRLENVPGVGTVSLAGNVQREIQVFINPKALEANGITADQVVNVLRTENVELPAGALKSNSTEQIVQIKGRIARPEDFGRLIVGRSAGQPIYLSQVARVVDSQEDISSLALLNGERVLMMSVIKAQGENTIAVVDGLKKAITDMQPVLDAQYPGLELQTVRDASYPIRTAVKNVQRTMIEGAILTILIVFLFLNSWRSTVITGLTLPIALIGTFLFIYAAGFTINMITLLALSLCVGLLIDDAIVVRENIVRHAQMGKSAYDSSMDGTKEIGMAVLATTLSIVAVFLPVGFMGGIIGRFFHSFGITVVAAILISMFVSFTLDPMLSSIWHDPDAHKPHGSKPANTLWGNTMGRVLYWFDRGTDKFAHTYADLLGWSLKHKGITLLLALATFLASFPIAKLLGTEFVPQADFGETFVSFYTPPGTSLAITEDKTRQVEAKLRAMKDVKYTLSSVGGTTGANYVSVYVKLVDKKERTLSQTQMSQPLRDQLSNIAGITVTSIGLTDPVGGEKTLSLSIQGSDLDTLSKLNTELQTKIKNIPGLVDLDSSLKPNKPIVSVELKRDIASDQGVSVNWAAQTLRYLIDGDSSTLWRAPDDQTYNVRVRLAPEARDNATEIGNMTLPTGQFNADGSAKTVTLRQIADVKSGVGANQINRKDLNREIYISANVYNRSSGEVSADIKKVLDEQMNFPPGYRYKFGGSTKNMAESAGYAAAALVLAIIFIYMVLASQFNSLLQPVAIMSSLPLTLIGVVLALLAFRSTISMFAIIGFVMLMGLVTKNAILLIDFANRARRGEVSEGLDAGKPLGREEALIAAARIRLRPILMTTLAMVFGMVPLAFGLSEGSEQRAPMGQAVIGGVITSSILTLVVVPVIYCYLDDFTAWFLRRVLGRRPARPIEAIAPVIN
jgi:hydrophobic/amphiphilic exporter-1 (mainly G- bacteria), HAE1 family